jgi:hypothetical protein
VRFTTLLLLVMPGCSLLIDDALSKKPASGMSGAGGNAGTSSSTSTASSSSGEPSSSNATSGSGGSGGSSSDASSSSGGGAPPTGCDGGVGIDCTCPLACVLPYAAATCSGETCVIQTCNPNHADCNHNRADGCEVNLKSDDLHCGDCMTACTAPAKCKGGTCK